MAQVNPHKHVSEGTREQETLKFNESGQPVLSSELSTSDDTVLTALAQLGACQTGTERSIISLFDSNRQYIIAEATPAQPLCSALPSDQCPEQLWLCGTAIPRNHGVCEHTLLGEIPQHEAAEPERRNLADLPLVLSQDLTSDPRFSSKPYCQLGSPARFYAAVPIRTHQGINIGVYCVINSKPTKAWTDELTTRLREISRTIMGHLESKRLWDLHRRNERMNRGIGSFIEGKTTLSGWQSGPDAAANCSGTEQDYTSDRAAAPDYCPEPRLFEPAQHASPGHQAYTSSFDPSIWDGIYFSSVDISAMDISSKAANIIRESIEVEGCVFFDATMAPYRILPLSSNTAEASGSVSSTSSSDQDEPSWPCCQPLGFSMFHNSGINGATSCPPGATMLAKFLTTLLQRYPKGSIFNFTANGELQSSNFSEDNQRLSESKVHVEEILSPGHADGSAPHASWAKQPKKPWSRKHEGSALRSAFPGARSVAFVPLWDSRKERWYGGGFIYTKSPSRTFTIKGELSYFRAFGMLAMAEVLRLETSMAEKAKSDILGSLSHELRSPLHGIFLSAELLMDTDLTVFQGNAAHTIETCARTLLDTIEHLLDYSKISNFAGGVNNSRAGETRYITGPGIDWGPEGTKNLSCNIRLDSVAEEVVETPEQLDRKSVNREESLLDEEDVSVFLLADPRCDWMCYVQVGAVRQIMMNIFSNALEYTRQGTIRVSLTQDLASIKHHKKERVQEDNLAPGLGLGLSLVKKITTQLGGKVSIVSEIGTGTTVSVMLPLSQVPYSTNIASLLSDDDKVFEQRVRDLAGLRVRVMPSDPGNEAGPDIPRNELEDICSKWLQMEIVSGVHKNKMTPDLILWPFKAIPPSFNFEMLANTPNIVICSNSTEAYRKSQWFNSAGRSKIFEFVAQPIGPRKLAKTLLHAYERWMGLRISTSVTIPSLVVRRPDGPENFPSTSVPRVDESAVSGLPSTHKVDDTTNPSSPPILPAQLLIVDDSYINLKLLSAYLKKLGLKYTQAVNGKEAVEHFTDNPRAYSCILMDISMPVMDGFEATRLIRAHERREGLDPVSIIALSGHTSEDAQREAFGSGFDLFLSKPVRLKAIGGLLEHRGFLNRSSIE
ncbi:hypothetical protein BGZ63DRAFT_418139 [Mariannaea sp. PMI_226]|nr:hypothetical protein BGZ63DRAFT_418139 [Mariannaea sp. PMI_226]